VRSSLFFILKGVLKSKAFLTFNNKHKDTEQEYQALKFGAAQVLLIFNTKIRNNKKLLRVKLQMVSVVDLQSLAFRVQFLLNSIILYL
jgi:hypothetical protein